MTYTTRQGDKWDSIAHSQLGSVFYTDRLMLANVQLIKYYIFPAGIILNIPEIEKGEPGTMPPWKIASG